VAWLAKDKDGSDAKHDGGVRADDVVSSDPHEAFMLVLVAVQVVLRVRRARLKAPKAAVHLIIKNNNHIKIALY
tara:strand:+ start:98 stop:319 length:222 start_codon:yes stop_codon:yes gene_type:complete